MKNRVFSLGLTMVLTLVMGCAQATPTVAPPTPTALPSTPTPTEAPTISVVDDAGRAVEITGVPERIISLAPSNTEVLFALGLGDKVVGVTDLCDYPEEAQEIEKVGFVEINLEKIVDLEPDLVLYIGGTAQLEKTQTMEDLGLTVLVLAPSDIEGIFADIELVGRTTGTEDEAADLVSELRARMDEVLSRVAQAKRQPLVFYELDATDPTRPWTAGPGSFIGALITMAGGVNLGASAEMEWAQFSTEEVIAQDPEIIILGDANYGVTAESVEERPGWGVITAVKGGAIYPIDDTLVSRPGPRIVDGLEELARIIHPELFK
ncbi:MAG: cobalamin-binding protein [Anaerolineae bacterium]